MAQAPVIVWFRRDLRLSDNPALHDAAASGAPLVPVFIHEPRDGPWAPGPASRWWLHRSLRGFAETLERLDGWLVIRQGPPAETLIALARETGAGAVWCNRRYEPAAAATDAAVAERLRGSGIAWRSCKGNLLHEPWERTARSGEPYQSFAAFWKACLDAGEPEHPLAAPARLAVPAARPADDPVATPYEPSEAAGWAALWTVGEAGAAARLRGFLQDGVARYAVARDLPDQHGTSMLSPHLAFGEIGPREIWGAVRAASLHSGEAFLRELGWREYCYHILHHAPALPDRPLRRQFDGFPWSSDEALFAAWREGRTGYPIVDAGMRALRATGWLHNRVRMIVASFLVKDLLLPWQAGEAWFWRHLLDADLACNAANWQWVAGCGIDAAPYFRIFNPVVQGEKFDARGRFVRRWVPELAGLSDLFIHRPEQAPADELARAGVRLGETYPRPVVDHGAARRRALAAYEQTRGAA